MSSPTNRYIFHDPLGRRWPWVKRLGVLLVLITSVLGMLLSATVLLLPHASSRGWPDDSFSSFLVPRLSHEESLRAYIAERQHKALLANILAEAHRKRAKHAGGTAPYSTVIGFYVNWEPNSFVSFSQHVDALSYVMPEWLSLSPDAQLFTSNFSTATRDPEMVALARAHHVPIVPILDNTSHDDFRWEPLRQLLSDLARQQTLAVRLRDYLLHEGYAGINIDLEVPYDQMTDAQVADSNRLLFTAMPRFIAMLRDALRPAGLLLTQDLPAYDDAKAYKQFGDLFAHLADMNDFVIFMLYDQHTPYGAPGPIASQTWVEQVAEQIFEKIDSKKIVLGIGNFSYDWPTNVAPDGSFTWAGKGRDILMGPALGIARKAGATIQMDEDDLNPFFTYRDDQDQAHVIYQLDAVTAYNQLQALKGYEPRGAALWYIGAEDPTIWSFFDDDTLARNMTTSGLAHVDFSHRLYIDMAPSGNEFMEVTTPAELGERTFTFDADGLITDEQYRRYPTPFVLNEFDAAGKTVALTFDDGPDPRYTPQILRILREHHVQATFFCMGKNATQYPAIIQQAWRDGNDIGNHTYTHPHIALVSPLRLEMEVNATESIFESLTGHMSLLFRPPYGDAPDSSRLAAEDTALLSSLYQNHYVTVGMNIDPKDYLKPPPDVLVERIIQQLPGNHVILLHDGGGDRSATIAALPNIITALQARGYHLTTVSGLLGHGWHARLFPPVSPEQRQVAGFDRQLFEIWYTMAGFLRVLFITAILLGVLRLLVFGTLAIIQRRRSARAARDTSYALPVTVVIPAYNEREVVCRTVESVLASDYPDVAVIVVDDGSTDGTTEALTARFGDDPRVTLVWQENGGKATALNAAFARAKTEIVVCIDADTQFTPATIHHLVQPFTDPRVGAVAGNVKVGNRLNLITLWQNLEYITSQNFDRLAFTALRAVAVVPGAVGAWRRAAVEEVGGFETATLAEDTDLTFKIRLAGYATVSANDALAYTEAPDSVRALAHQRFRWAFGILQALWKHRGQLFRPRYGAFALVVMPSMWIFNILLVALTPIVDISIIGMLLTGKYMTVIYFTAAFFTLDLVTSTIAFRLDREDPRQLAWLFWQRFFYREFMFYTILRALLAAARGRLVGWGKLHRKATVALPSD